MGADLCRPIALVLSLLLDVAASSLSAQSVPQAPDSVALSSAALSNENAALLELRRAVPLSRQEEAALRPLDRFRECAHCPEMVVVSDGSFTMGASTDEIGSTGDERPLHPVTVQRFAVGRHPVTSDEWQACVVEKGCSHEGERAAGHGEYPVGGILWEEAHEYVAWLSRSIGRPYRLLSEAEREYVARAGTATAFWWGDMADPHSADAASADLIGDVGIVTTSMFGATPDRANPFGLFAVHGSVYDWVEDCWHDDYAGAPGDGSAWTELDCQRHVMRGGATGRLPQTRRSAARLWFGSPNRISYMSVRVARSLGR